MDAAFERRFLYKIKFENPTVEAKTAIWKSKLNWISEEKAKQLAKEYDFSGGEIDNIVRKATMEEILNGSTVTINRLKELCNTEKLINSNSEKKIGFYI
jgi:SpoVK/Ycf46/Vps4 family AAA+-type ATPase